MQRSTDRQKLGQNSASTLSISQLAPNECGQLRHLRCHQNLSASLAYPWPTSFTTHTMDVSIGHVVPNIEYKAHEKSFLQRPKFANYLPDELLLEVLSYIPTGRDSQTLLAVFCLVSRQWYDVAVQRLYEAPYLAGRTYDLFVRTICPSVNTHIKKSELAGLGMSPPLSV